MNILINESQYGRLFRQKVNFKVIGNVGNILIESLSKEEFNDLSIQIRSKLKEINPFFGYFTDKRTNKEMKGEFNIIPKNHFIERTKRLSDPEYSIGGKKYDPNIKNPDLFEGIELLVNNADELMKLISTKRIQSDDIVQFSTRDKSEYHMIVKFDPRSLSEVVYNLILITQIKGSPFYSKSYQKSFNLFKKK